MLSHSQLFSSQFNIKFSFLTLNFQVVNCSFSSPFKYQVFLSYSQFPSSKLFIFISIQYQVFLSYSQFPSKLFIFISIQYQVFLSYFQFPSSKLFIFISIQISSFLLSYYQNPSLAGLTISK